VQNVAAVSLYLLLTAVVAAAPAPLAAASHKVAIEVREVYAISIIGGDVHLIVGGARAGQPPATASDSSTALAYTINSRCAKKITAQLDHPYTQGVDLQVAVDAPHTTGVQTLRTAAVAVVSGVAQVGIRSAPLTYTASIAAGTGTLTETRTVTYTIVDN
jgi:hypothetical protein